MFEEFEEFEEIDLEIREEEDCTVVRYNDLSKFLAYCVFSKIEEEKKEEDKS